MLYWHFLFYFIFSNAEVEFKTKAKEEEREMEGKAVKPYFFEFISKIIYVTLFTPL